MSSQLRRSRIYELAQAQIDNEFMCAQEASELCLEERRTDFEVAQAAYAEDPSSINEMHLQAARLFLTNQEALAHNEDTLYRLRSAGVAAERTLDHVEILLGQTTSPLSVTENIMRACRHAITQLIRP